MSETNIFTEPFTVIENTPDLILYFEFNPHVRVAYINPTIKALTLYEENEFYRDPELFLSIIHPDDRHILQELFQTGNSGFVEFRLIKKSGAIISVQGDFKGLFNSNQKPVFISGILKEVKMESKKRRRSQVSSEIARKIEKHIEEITFISQFGQSLGDNHSPESIFHALAMAFNRFYPDVYSLFLSEAQRDGKKLKCVYARVSGKNLDLSTLGDDVTVQTALNIQNRVAEHKKAILQSTTLQSNFFKVEETTGDQPQMSSVIVPMITGKKVIGMVHMQSTFVGRFTEQDVYFITSLTNIAAAVLENTRGGNELINAYDTTIEGWGRAVDLRDHESEGHCVRVADLSRRLAYRLGLRGERVVNLWRGGILHDIGKLGLSEAVLFKEGALDQNEWAEMRRHPQYAYDILRRIPFLKETTDIPYCHHEKWDGSGYPRGLKGVAIPLEARIFAVADVWDALLSDRPYRHAWERPRVIEYIRTNLGTHFDPVIGEEFLRMVEEENIE